MKLLIEWQYKTKKGVTTLFRSDRVSAQEVLQLAEDIEQTGRVKTLSIIDEHDSSWTMKELRSYLKEIQTEPHHIKVYFDGGFQQDTRAAAIGVVIYYEKNNKSWRKRLNAELTDIVSNNEAEYAALHASVTELLLMDIHHQTIEFFGDSQVVIRQMSDEWPVYEQELAAWALKIDQLLASRGIVASFQHIPRKVNSEADQLASQGLAGKIIYSELEIDSRSK